MRVDVTYVTPGNSQQSNSLNGAAKGSSTQNGEEP